MLAIICNGNLDDAMDWCAPFNEKETEWFARRIQRAVDLSFQQDGSRRTGAETRRRIELACRIVKVLMNEHQFSPARAINEVPAGLRFELDGTRWNPGSHRGMWAPVESFWGREAG